MVTTPGMDIAMASAAGARRVVTTVVDVGPPDTLDPVHTPDLVHTVDLPHTVGQHTVAPHTVGQHTVAVADTRNTNAN
ncbi:MAG: hypothetical protein WA532_12650 [Candidatus Korobacteraceae bacterium]